MGYKGSQHGNSARARLLLISLSTQLPVIKLEVRRAEPECSVVGLKAESHPLPILSAW